MSVKVDPFVIPIPLKWSEDPEIGPTVQYMWRFLYDLWRRTGGGSDQVSNQQLRELYPWMAGQNGQQSSPNVVFAPYCPTSKWTPEFKAPQSHDALPAFATPAQFNQFPSFAVGAAKPAFFSVSAGHTTSGNEIVEATSNITVTLNATPDTDEIVIVKRNTGAGTVTVDGNGRNIDGAATYSLSTNYNTVTAIYSVASNIWLTI